MLSHFLYRRLSYRHRGSAFGENRRSPVLGGDVDTADEVVLAVLQYTTGAGTLGEGHKPAARCAGESTASAEGATVCVPRAGARRDAGPGAHGNKRKGAARGDRDVVGVVELGGGAVAVDPARSAHAAGEGGGRPSGDVDTADEVVVPVLQYPTGAGTLGEGHKLAARCAGKSTASAEGATLCA